jgi:hypothetical protein
MTILDIESYLKFKFQLFQKLNSPFKQIKTTNNYY